MKSKYIAWLPVIFGVYMLVLEVQCTGPDKLKNELSLSEYASLSDSTQYMGMHTCRECHESIYNTFIQTGMGKSFNPSSKLKSSAKFDQNALVYDPENDFYYHPFWEKDSLRVKEFRMRGRDTIFSRTETINYIVGSGQHTNSHIMSRNGYLHQIPVTFYTQKEKWDLAPGFESGGNSRFDRLIGLECMSCHNAYPNFVIGSENKYNRVGNGIDCERCHGPGSVHVALKKKGNIVDITREIDYSIVNPAKLPVDLQFDVCQRCHIQGNAILNGDKSFYDFRPGMSLSSVMNVFMPVFTGNEEDHIMASHVERLKQSRCYSVTSERLGKRNQAGSKVQLHPYKDAFTCVSCHNPHISVTATGSESFNNSCNGCHQNGKEPGCRIKPEMLEKARFNCVSCHMPKSKATDIPHVQVTDHRIRIPIEASKGKKQKKGSFSGIACINNPDAPVISKAIAFMAYFEKFGYSRTVLDSAMKYLPDSTSGLIKKNFHELVQLAFLNENYQKVVDYARQVGNPLLILNRKSFSNRDAWCCYRLGESFNKTGKIREALQFYQRAVELAPFEMDFQNKYGASLVENNRPVEAIKTFEFIISENPGFYKAYSNLGFLVLKMQNDSSRALMLYTQALKLDPDYEPALLNMAGLHILKGQLEEAKMILGKILVKNKNHEKAGKLLHQLITQL